jgi:large subunit ribosomal protein L19e
MTNLTSQRRLASRIMKVGQNRVWIDPQRIDDVEGAITRQEIKKLVHEKIIKAAAIQGVSRGRTKTLREKKNKGRRNGIGNQSGTSHARVSKKEAWMKKIRALRKRLRTLKAGRVITESNYRQLYMMAGSGRFNSVADMERYAKAHDLWRKR